jgi:hypothetical protein
VLTNRFEVAALWVKLRLRVDSATRHEEAWRTENIAPRILGLRIR